MNKTQKVFFSHVHCKRDSTCFLIFQRASDRNYIVVIDGDNQVLKVKVSMQFIL